MFNTYLNALHLIGHYYATNTRRSPLTMDLVKKSKFTTLYLLPNTIHTIHRFKTVSKIFNDISELNTLLLEVLKKLHAIFTPHKQEILFQGS